MLAEIDEPRNGQDTIQFNTISFNGTKTPQLTQTQLRITREKQRKDQSFIVSFASVVVIGVDC